MADVSSSNLRRKLKDILKDADLSTLSAKKVRLELQAAFDTDLSSRKKEIDQMIMKQIVELEEKNKEEEDKGVSEEEEEDNGQNQAHSENEEAAEPPKKKTKATPVKKKQKKKRAHEDDDELAPLENDDLNAYDEEQRTLKLSDEELAKRLQSFEDTGRRTRNNTNPKKEKKKRTGANNTTNNAYIRPCVLSPTLAAVMETEQLPRNEVIAKMWKIVKERKLQDPKDTRFIICDEQLRKVFGRKRVKTFGMMKYLQSHFRDDASSLESVITNTDIYDDEADDD